MYVPEIPYSDSLKMPQIGVIREDSIPTIQMGVQDAVKTLTIDLSSIKDAPTPSDVTIKIKLQEGQILAYSVTVAKQEEKKTTAPAKVGAKTSAIYVVRKGDTATSLAKKFAVRVSQIRQPLIIGRKLIIDED